MLLDNKTIWSDGMPLRPQHFQQQDRFVEALIEQRCGDIRGYGWGFSHLVIDEAQLALGKLAVSEGRGVFPDGTPFRIPGSVDPPTPLDVPVNAKDVKAMLALALRRPGLPEVALDDDDASLARYASTEFDVPDTASEQREDNAAPLEVGRLRVKLVLEQGEEGAYTTLGVGRIRERRADNQVELDPGFIPPCLDYRAGRPLAAFVQELVGHLRQKGDSLAGRVSTVGSGGTAEFVDFLFLMVVNRFEPVFEHLRDANGVHPEVCFQAMLQLAGELATVTRRERRPIPKPVYDHDNLDITFENLVVELRRSIQWFEQPRALPIALVCYPKHGVWVGQIDDRSLLGAARFVLSVRAEVPARRLLNAIPSQVTVGPEQQISELVSSHVKGIVLQSLASAPRELPFYSGAAYFELDHASEYWKAMEVSGGLAFHVPVAESFPGLEMELWAIRE